MEIWREGGREIEKMERQRERDGGGGMGISDLTMIHKCSLYVLQTF